MNDRGKLDDIFTRMGQQFGDELSDAVVSTAIRTMTVASVDENQKVCYAYIFEDDEPLPIPLQILGGNMVVVPAIDSIVVVGFMNRDQNAPFIINTVEPRAIVFERSNTTVDWSTDPDDPSADLLSITVGGSQLKVSDGLIEFNGGTLDGLVAINALTDRINEFVSKFNSHTHLIPAGTFLIGATAGVPNTGLEETAATLGTEDDFSKDDYENEKITQ